MTTFPCKVVWADISKFIQNESRMTIEEWEKYRAFIDALTADTEQGRTLRILHNVMINVTDSYFQYADITHYACGQTITRRTTWLKSSPPGKVIKIIPLAHQSSEVYPDVAGNPRA